MNTIAIARRFRGMLAQTLADQMGISYQQIGNWEQGSRNPGRASAQQLAEALDVDVAWIMDFPQLAQLADPLSGEIISARIMRTEELPGYGILHHLYLPEHEMVVAVIRSLDVSFTTTDWQGQQPGSATEIADYDWMDMRGNGAIMIDGLPRTLA